ncbi:hypothetical protein [Methylobacterium pseudosasicola]|uniref:Uncharacterized protein n=1 Tax=Methylobacterium pseudosasicola TaxID=582667 RepID=A0A1I4K5C4_9HYPH|nr:hypothetical protein [Methylobacterium pseudosasicola]SFL73968.1 hypothetical protein SAMN05192568_1009160 [Methylobacterium pseudosasicola]
MPGRTRSRYTTFLVSVTAERSGGRGRSTAKPAPLVYAVMKPNAEAAMEAVRSLAEGPVVVAIVGSLSTRVSKGLKLKPGEPRAV